MPGVTGAPVSGSLCGTGFLVVGGGGVSPGGLWPGGSAGGSTTLGCSGVLCVVWQGRSTVHWAGGMLPVPKALLSTVFFQAWSSIFTV